MKIEFEGKVVLITGATSGIGFESARLFGAQGARVAICGRNGRKLKVAYELLKQENVEVLAEQCDVSSFEEVSRFAENVYNRFGQINIWISNAGYYPQFSIIDTPEEVWEKTIGTNQKAVYLGAKITYRYMKKTGGVMLLASSFSAVMPSVGSGAYAATKAAVSSMVKTLAAELAPYNIRVNGYIPGVIVTEMTESIIAQNEKSMLLGISQQKFGEAIDVAWALAFLASDYAQYITGTTLEISGGKMGTQNPSRAWDDKLKREKTSK